MTIGEKIKRVRTFRGMTQKELGNALGLGEKGDNRIAQYEMGYRVPKKDLLDKMAEALNVYRYALYETSAGDATEIMEMLFWLDEEQPSIIKLFKMQWVKGQYNVTDDLVANYVDNDELPGHTPTGLFFDYTVLDSFLAEWRVRKEELRRQEITNDEYFEWKLNWPYTCDGCGKFEPQKKWRKAEPAEG